MLNSSELYDFMTYMTQDERSMSMQFTSHAKVGIVATFVATIVWGSLMKFFLYFNLLQEKLSERPINALILVDQFVGHLTNLIIDVSAIVKVLLIIFISNNDHN